MLKKTITYHTFDGDELTEDFYFHLSKAEVMEMEMGTTGGMTKMINRIIASKNSKEIVDTFKKIILKSYGEKSPDGKRFIKNQGIRDGFEQTEAYSILFMELAMDAEASSVFVNGIMPKAE